MKGTALQGPSTLTTVMIIPQGYFNITALRMLATPRIPPSVISVWVNPQIRSEHGHAFDRPRSSLCMTTVCFAPQVHSSTTIFWIAPQVQFKHGHRWEQSPLTPNRPHFGVLHKFTRTLTQFTSIHKVNPKRNHHLGQSTSVFQHDRNWNGSATHSIHDQLLG